MPRSQSGTAQSAAACSVPPYPGRTIEIQHNSICLECMSISSRKISLLRPCSDSRGGNEVLSSPGTPTRVLKFQIP